MLKDYDMCVNYNSGKSNGLDDTLRRLSMRSTSHVHDGKKELVKDVHRMAGQDVWLMASTSGGSSIHPFFEYFLVTEVKKC